MPSRMIVLLAAALMACGQAPDLGRERAALLAADRAFDSLVAARGLDAWVETFADSGRQVDGRGEFVVGHAAIREEMRGLLGDSTRTLRWSPDYSEVAQDGSLGYTMGRWTLARRGPGTPEELSRGRYLTVWRKQPDGRWKAVADIGNESRR